MRRSALVCSALSLAGCFAREVDPDVASPPDVTVDAAEADVCASGTVCNGTCVALATDVHHCGACDTVCPTPTNGAPVCSGGACAIACNRGYTLTAGACIADLMRPVSPLSTATVTSHHPTLRWATPPGTTRTHVELFHDRACTSPIASFDVDGTSLAVPQDLSPARIVYWRVRSLDTNVVSAVWQFTLGMRSAAIDTSWGTTLDLDGDGLAEVAIGSSVVVTAQMGVTLQSNHVYVYPGSAAGPSPTPARSVIVPLGGSRRGATSIVSAGDVNGDGYADLAVGADTANNATGAVYLYFGGPGSPALTPSVTLPAPDGENGGFGISVASVGDVDRDGYADLLVGANTVGAMRGSAYLYRGGPNGPATTPSVTLVGRDGEGGFFGQAVTSAGDADGDGFNDIAVGAFGARTGTGRVYLYRGGPGGLETNPAESLTGPDGTNGFFGLAIANANDVNGDGLADLVVGAFSVDVDRGRAYLFAGSAGLGATLPTATLATPTGGDIHFGLSVAGLDDVDGDGFADVAVGANNTSQGAGAAYVYLGGPGGIPTTPAWTLLPADGSGTGFGVPIVGAGDVDGDGRPDVLVTGSGYHADAGRAYFYSGATFVPGALPSVRFDTPDGPNDSFGFALAALSWGRAPSAVPTRTPDRT